jgi:hypothetical protein
MVTSLDVRRRSVGNVVRSVLAAGVLTLLLSSLWAGLLRLGWALPAPHGSLALLHGPLFVCGMLGTVIGLERAVALGRPWTFVGPALTLIGGIGLVAGMPIGLGALLMVGGSLGLLAVFAALLKRQPARFVVTMALGAAALLSGNLLWLGGWPYSVAALWWAGFLILTIVGERLELGRLRQLPPRALWSFTVGVGLLLLGLLVAVGWFDLGVRLVGASFLALGVWLLRYDIARRTIRRPGVPRFSAICILSGSAWLVVGGVIALFAGAQYAGPLYDAMLHAVFVGFVFAMIFGHAPIIIPALLKLPITFSAWSYLPLALLHISLVLRTGGNLAGLVDLRRWGGMLNAVTIVLFLLITMLSVVHANRKAPADPEYAAHACTPGSIRR